MGVELSACRMGVELSEEWESRIILR